MAQEENKNVQATPETAAPKKKGGNFKSISGKGQELYVESIFVNSVKGKDGQPKDLISATVRKRRDVSAEKDYGGAYVTNRAGKDKKTGQPRMFHSQVINKDALNKILEVNDAKALTEEDLHAYATNRQAVALGESELAFKANVFSDSAHKGSHAFNPKSIEKTDTPFSYKVEKELNDKAVAARKEAEAQKDSQSAAEQAVNEDDLDVEP